MGLVKLAHRSGWQGVVFPQNLGFLVVNHSGKGDGVGVINTPWRCRGMGGHGRGVSFLITV